MTTYWGPNPFTGESDAGQPESRPKPDELALLQWVRDGLKKQPAESSSDEGEAAA